MPSSEPVLAADLVVTLDYGQFYLRNDEWLEDLPALVDRATDSGIEADEGTVVVISPHQNNFEMPLRIEVHESVPVDDLDEWEEAFEVHLDVDAGGLFYESPTLESVLLPVPEGSYHALITGRGFVAHGWPGSTTPGDRWRIQLWSSNGPERARRLKPVAATGPDTTSTWEAIVAQVPTAIGRINAAIGAGDGGGFFLPRDGVAEVARWLPGDPAAVFRDVLAIGRDRVDEVVTRPVVTSVSVGSAGNAGDHASGLPLGPPVVPAGGLPAVGYRLRGEFRSHEHTVEDSSHATLFLNWERLLPPDGSVVSEIFWPGTVVEVELSAEEHDGTPGTVVRMTHTGLPRTWTVDVAAVWEGYLAHRFRARGGTSWAGSAPHPVQPPSPAELAEAAARESAQVAALQEEKARNEAYLAASTAEHIRLWGGRLPTERLRLLGGGTEALALQHRDVLDRLEALGADEQRAIARWLVHRVVENTGMSELAWFTAGLDAMDAGLPLPPPFDDQNRLTRTAFALETSDGGSTRFSNPVMAAHFPRYALIPDPLVAAVQALADSSRVIGEQGRDQLITALRRHLAG